MLCQQQVMIGYWTAFVELEAAIRQFPQGAL
jgi:hypothetical protein